MSSTSPQRRSALPRFAEVAVERARLSVVPRLRTKAPRVPFVTLVSVILLAGVVGLLLFNTSMQQASFTASRLEAQSEDLTARQQQLAMQIDRLRDPGNLAEAACGLGMVVPPTVAFIDKATGKISGVPQVAEAVPGPCGAQKSRPKRPQPLAPDIPAGTTGAAGASGPTVPTGGAGSAATGTTATTGTTGTTATTATATGAARGQSPRSGR